MWWEHKKLPERKCGRLTLGTISPVFLPRRLSLSLSLSLSQVHTLDSNTSMDPSNQNPSIATAPTDSNTSMDPSNQNPQIEPPPRAPSRRSLSSLRRSLELSLCLWVGLSRYLCQLVGLSPRRSSSSPSPSPSPSPQVQRPPLCQGSGFRSVLFFFVAIAYLVLIPSTSSIKSSLSILHQVPEGHVGVYWRGGALLNTISDPGFHLKMPFVTQYEPVQVTLQTDQVKDIPCGTNGGVMINFEKIEVVNRLHKDYVYETLLNYGVQYNHMWIYDKIHHEINKFCSSHSLQQVYIDVFDQIDEKMKDALQRDCTRYAPGIEIISIHVTKPTIPDSIRRTFELLEEERIKVLIAIEKQKIADKEADTMKRMAISEAEKFASVSEILMGQKEMKKDSARRQQDIENQIYTWLGRRVWQMLKESQICTQFMEGVWQMLISIFQ